MNTPGLVAYAWAGGTGQPPPCYSTAIFGVYEAGDAYYGVIGEPLPFWAPEAADDQLRRWEADLNATAPAGVYTCTYDPATQRMTIATTNGVAFRPVMFENSALWTGFTQTMAGTATSWTGASAPMAVQHLAGIVVEPAEDGARVELHTYRQARAVSSAWGNHALHQVLLILVGDGDELGFVLGGRVRIYQGGNVLAYSALNPGGVVDGFVVASADMVETSEYRTMKLLVAVQRE